MAPLQESSKRRVLYRSTSGGDIPLPDWFCISLALFQEHVLNTAYPCHFATTAEKRGELLFTYVDGRDDTHLPETLSQFLTFFSAHPERLYALAIFYQPEETVRQLDYYRRTFWQLLRFLHEHDPAPWPQQLPPDPANPDWLFAFGGISAFPFVLAPAYRRRKSRNLGPGMIIIYTSVSEPVRTSPAPPVQAMLHTIRQRVALWDGMPAYQTRAGQRGERYGWKNMVIPDENSTPAPAVCPWHNLARRVPPQK